MIELIFAIVIMGIVLMSAPMLISTATQSAYVAIQQEAINEAASRVNMIMSYPWDENNTQEDNIFPILHVTNGEGALDMNTTTKRRNGTPKESQRTFVFSDPSISNLNATALGSDSGDKDDMDDFEGSTVGFNTASASTDYIDNNISIATAIRYMKAGSLTPDATKTIYFSSNFTQNIPTTNIKSISVTLTSSSGVSELNTSIKLHAFSCNIGSYTLKERTF